MKDFKYLLVVLLFIVSLSSCDRDEPIEKNSHIVGEWIWVQSSGGIAGTTMTPESTGKEILLKISSQSVEMFENGELKSTMEYEIINGESIRTIEKIPLIVYENGSKQSFERQVNKLFLYDECFDCFQSEYTRVISN